MGMPAEDLTGVDPSAGMLKENRRQHPVRLVQGVGEHLPFPTRRSISSRWATRCGTWRIWARSSPSSGAC
jgi:hypothetical protein